METYEHGGNIKQFAKQNNCNIEDIVDLSSNINFLKPKCSIDFNNLDISAYPNYEKLYKKVAKHYEVKNSQLELFNGGSSAIFSLFKELSLRKCVIYSPAYLEYKKAAIQHGYELHIINRFDDIYKKVPKDALVIFVNPSTPDGQYYNIHKLMKLWEKQNCTVLVDESFIEFCNKSSIVQYIKKYKNLYILKSMTKIFSAAGIRIGTLISNSKNIQKIQEKEPLWKISQFDMNYLLHVIKNKTFIDETKEITKENRKLLIKTLQQYTFIEKIFKSNANYLLIKLKGLTAKQLQRKLAQHHIMIRDCSNFDCLDENYVRIAIKSKDSIKKLKNALNKL